MQILCHCSEAPARFAASELKDYLARMGMPALSYELDVRDLSDYGLPPVADAALDDQYYIDVNAEHQLIFGNNARALLLGVYRYLTRIGCRFLRPGKEFEVVPVLECLTAFYTSEAHTASMRHRGVCLEGASSIENIVEFLDWSPKVGFNSFFFQFKYPHTFLERWYHHIYNPLLPPVHWTMEDSQRVMPYLTEAAAQRGLLQHRVGHGWTSEVLGCEATGWDTEAASVAPENRAMIAEVNGKREIFGGVPTNTNLCLSNPQAVEKFADLVVAYAKDNPDADYLHIWLADASNNSCSCEHCRDLRPSDHYVALLNYLDQKLTQAGSSMRLVLLLYVDLLWAPEHNKIENPDRFVLMFAPITRTFESSFADHGPLQPEPEFRLNQLTFPSDLETNLTFLKDWQKAAPCDSFVYDYPLGRAHYGDPAYVGIARIIYRDLQYNHALGLNGINSCQELRAAFPNALPNYVMARVSMDTSLSFEAIADEYYEAAYGKQGPQLWPLMEKVSALFSTDFAMNIGPRVRPELAERMQQVPAALAPIRALIQNHGPHVTSVQATMWRELEFFVDYTLTLAKALELATSDHPAEATAVYEQEFKPLIQRHEMSDQRGLDVYRVLHIYNTALNPNRA